MRSWRYCVNPAVISIAPLTAILVMTAAVSAIAGTKDDRVACDERSFTPDDAALRIGQANDTPDMRHHLGINTFTDTTKSTNKICKSRVCSSKPLTQR